MIRNLRQSPILNFLTRGQIADPLKETLEMEIPEDILGGKENALEFVEMVEAMLDSIQEDEPLPNWANPDEPILSSDGIPVEVPLEECPLIINRLATIQDYCEKLKPKGFFIDLPGTTDFYTIKIQVE